MLHETIGGKTASRLAFTLSGLGLGNLEANKALRKEVTKLQVAKNGVVKWVSGEGEVINFDPRKTI